MKTWIKNVIKIYSVVSELNCKDGQVDRLTWLAIIYAFTSCSLYKERLKFAYVYQKCLRWLHRAVEGDAFPSPVSQKNETLATESSKYNHHD
jgi:hypothetical protein